MGLFGLFSNDGHIDGGEWAFINETLFTDDTGADADEFENWDF